jgi:hypothetical protein
LTNCGGTCTSLQIDPANCGSCAHVCPAANACAGAQCVPLAVYAIGGMITGLGSSTVVLQDNGTDNLSVGADGAFTFATRLLTGTPYAVSVLTNPPGLYCSVTSGSGAVAGANVTTVMVDCRPSNGTVLDASGASHPILMVPCGDGTTTNCTEAVAQTSCTSQGLKLISDASDGTASVVSLGATSSCSWSISYYTSTSQALAGQCLIAISNAYWSDCCDLGGWHGNTVMIPTTVGQQFGYEQPGESGYNGSLSNVSQDNWGCDDLSTPPPPLDGCTTYNVACM